MEAKVRSTWYNGSGHNITVIFNSLYHSIIRIQKAGVVNTYVVIKYKTRIWKLT